MKKSKLRNIIRHTIKEQVMTEKVITEQLGITCANISYTAECPYNSFGSNNTQHNEGCSTLDGNMPTQADIGTFVLRTEPQFQAAGGPNGGPTIYKITAVETSSNWGNSCGGGIGPGVCEWVTETQYCGEPEPTGSNDPCYACPYQYIYSGTGMQYGVNGQYYCAGSACGNQSNTAFASNPAQVNSSTADPNTGYCGTTYGGAPGQPSSYQYDYYLTPPNCGGTEPTGSLGETNSHNKIDMTICDCQGENCPQTINIPTFLGANFPLASITPGSTQNVGFQCNGQMCTTADVGNVFEMSYYGTVITYTLDGFDVEINVTNMLHDGITSTCPGRTNEDKGCMDPNALNNGECCSGDPNCTVIASNPECCKYEDNPDEKGCMDPNALNYMGCCPQSNYPGCVATVPYDECCKYEGGGDEKCCDWCATLLPNIPSTPPLGCEDWNCDDCPPPSDTDKKDIKGRMQELAFKGKR